MADFKLSADSDYVITNGSFELDGTARTAVILALLDQRGRFWADLRIGSRIDELFQGVPPRDPVGAIEGVVREALTPLVQSGRIRSFETEVMNASPFLTTVRVQDGRQDAPLVFTMTPVG